MTATPEIFELPDYWRQAFFAFQHLAMILLPLFFMIAILLYVLNAFEGVRLESKVFQLIVTIFLILIWPQVLAGVKILVDDFNQFLVRDVFQMNQQATLLSPSTLTELSNALDFGGNWYNPKHLVNFLLVLLLVASKLIIYSLFLVFFFFYAALGPVVIARGVLSEELSVAMDLAKEVAILLLWQSTFVIVVGLLDKTVGTTPHFMIEGNSGFFWEAGKALGLAVLILFVPTLTRKFVGNIGATFVPLGFKMGGAALGFSVLAGIIKAPAKLAGAAEVAEAGGIVEMMTAGAEKVFHYFERSHLHSRAHEAEEEAEKHREDLLRSQEEHRMAAEGVEAETESEVEHVRTELHAAAHRAEVETATAMEVTEEEIVEEMGAGAPPPPRPAGAPPAGPRPPKRGFGFREALKEAFFKRPTTEWRQADAEKFGDQIRKNAIRRLSLYTRGPKDSDKYKDMEKLGIEHKLFESDNMDELRRYQAQLDRFNSRFGWLYDFEGKFIGPENQRPKSWEETPPTPPEKPGGETT